MVKNLDRLNKLNNKIRNKISMYEKINIQIKSQSLRFINNIDVTEDKDLQSYLQNAILVKVQQKASQYRELAEKLSLKDEDLDFIEEYIDRI